MDSLGALPHAEVDGDDQHLGDQVHPPYFPVRRGEPTQQVNKETRMHYVLDPICYSRHFSVFLHNSSIPKARTAVNCCLIPNFFLFRTSWKGNCAD